MATRKEIKQEAVARVKDERAAKRARKDELEAMTSDERTAAKASDKTAARDAKAAAKEERAEVRSTMNRAQRRELKRRERVYRKVKHRPRRAIGWGLTAAAGIGVVALAAPYASAFGRIAGLEFNDAGPEAVAAREAALEVVEAISDEGMVLVQNDDDVLPLADAAKVNVFSFASFNLLLGGGGSGGTAVAGAPTLYEGLEGQGIEYNEDLYATMEEAGAEHTEGSSNFLVQIAEMAMGNAGNAEPAPDYLTDEVMEQAAGYSDTAIVTIGVAGGEGTDLTQEGLQLTDEQIALLDTVTAHQDDVILVVNAGNQMELGFVEDYPQIKSVVWMGIPGPQGAVSLAKIMSGEVNPSGRLTDTYAYDVASAPGAENLGSHSYTNADRAFLEYEEGIYVGYRYYETRYLDDEAGYEAAVQYPFGHGLSYTDFQWDAIEPVITDDTVTVDVEVTNTGDVAGKDVVQAYFSAPYNGGIEKSAIELAGYAKTGELEPGQSETVTIEWDVQDMASWDTEAGNYVLDAGDYAISMATNVHTPVATFDHEVADAVVYTADADTGYEYASQFAFAEGDVTYLSRDDWEGTYPTAPDGTEEASDEVLALMDPEIVPAEGEAPTYGADNGIELADLVGLDMDDPQWDAFLDQLTLDETIELFSYGAYKTAEVDRLGIPSMTMLDSPAGLNSLFASLEAAAYPSEIVIASTWNDELAYAVGESVGTEAGIYGVDVWYAPGMNLHRTAMGGRDFEYFSEDPLISGKMAAGMVNGAQDQGVLTTIKHFVLNDQEVNARSGINVFTSEQALRELYLAPFEIAVKESAPTGAMSSFINIGGKWAGGSSELLQNVLRGEWGFDGFVSTDAVLGSWMDPAQAALNGNDVMLAVLAPGTVSATEAAVEEDPVGIGNGLRDRVHQLLYTVTLTGALS
ncbi:glycoside hydrolase family 3 protein [Demequina mangrovi]|uniref:Beta-glucosidase n=1 Tax=Demequina mangrovi TaxID=1043493 RepID=A0A1H6YV36_9MICO|nr:glycoside hydrolase family 3 protein [Demequina mangrovi]SEJ45079.1 beta-glucosidase [Demequina mangrovi]